MHLFTVHAVYMQHTKHQIPLIIIMGYTILSIVYPMNNSNYAHHIITKEL